MIQHLNIEKKRQTKRAASERKQDFNYIYEKLETFEAESQASRCVQCPVDQFKEIMVQPRFCRTGCPLSNKIPDWLKATYEENYEKASIFSHEMSPFPEILGRVCPKQGLCESSCSLEHSPYGAVSIGEIETYLNETAFGNGFKPSYTSEVKKDAKVAVIGSGPASMACASFLLREGISVEMFEKSDRCGGLLTYGIPNFKLPKEVVARRIEWMQEAGMVVHTHTEVGKDVSMEKLTAEFDYLFLGLGAPNGRSARMKNENAKGVYQVMEVLSNEQKTVFSGDINASLLKDKNVVVIGGGDSAMDAVRTAIRQGAKSSTCIYRRDEFSMPGSRSEVINAHEEGVKFLFNQAPAAVIMDESMNATGIELTKTKLELFPGGKRKLIMLEDEKSEVEADVIILALGFDNKMFDFYTPLNIELGKWNEVTVDANQRTSNEKVYAGGDIVRGADLAVRAALDGRTAALDIIERVSAQL